MTDEIQTFKISEQKKLINQVKREISTIVPYNIDGYINCYYLFGVLFCYIDIVIDSKIDIDDNDMDLNKYLNYIYPVPQKFHFQEFILSI